LSFLPDIISGTFYAIMSIWISTKLTGLALTPLAGTEKI
jgi:hypothetical protein